ncbi:uncharacterized protein LOC143297085 [Babylonia areolata]|uniref:uncharacterized protein LOC143297085 n=1 Tax=Babylonia areolata TaxID=304850 RepID=UPI003FD60C67
MDSMKELKDWLVTKCRLPGFQQTLKPPDNPESKYTTNIVTPQSIPEFVIPGSGESSRNPSICSSDDLRSHSSGMSVTCSPSNSPAPSPRNSLVGLAVPDKSPVKVRSAPVSPRRDSHGFLRDFGVRSMCNLQPAFPRVDGGNGGGNSGGGVEVPYLRSRHSLGVLTIKESPQHRRKSSFQNLRSDGSDQQRYNQSFARRPFRSQESLSLQDGAGAACAPLEQSCLSAHTSTRRCSPVFTDQNDYLPLRESFRRSQRYYRRRSSLAQVEMTAALWRQDSDAGGSTSESPAPARRLPVHTLSAPHHPAHAQKRHSAPSATCSISISLHDHDQHEACSSGHTPAPSLSSSSRGEDRGNGGGGGGERNGAEGGRTVLTERGDIKFSFQYFPATRRLKLLLIRAENLHFPERPDVILNPFFKVYLMPGKLQKQTSETVKHTRNPVYNREFFFNDIKMEDLRNLRLRIKAFHKSQNLKLAEYLGEVNIPLANYDLLMENRMWNDLHFKPYEQDLGHLQVELLLEPRDDRLTVGVVQAKGLPSHHLAGAPDPYVCARIEQHGRVIAERQTRMRKKTCDPVFREWFEVRLPCCPEDLRDTKVRFRVFDHERLRSDPILGELWLGRGAREESVLTHWQEMMHAPGRKLRRWHYILGSEETTVSS